MNHHVKHGMAIAVVAGLFQADVAGHRPIQTEPVVGSPLAVRESAQPEDGEPARRAEVEALLTDVEALLTDVEALLTDVEARVEAMSAQRECAPRVSLLGLVHMFRADLEPSPPSDIERVRRLMKGVVELDKLVRLYDSARNATCEIYNLFDEARREEELSLRRHARAILAAHLFGE